jgi:hypothetical protein
MLVQRRGGALRLIRQHDHALLAGALAFCWRAADGGALSARTALATALHDAVWIAEDEQPRLDVASGAPHDFTSLPGSEKRRFVERGLARMGQVDPDAAALVGAHHRALAEGVQVDPASELAWLRFFDNLSLFICLTAPGSLPDARPGWLTAERIVPPTGSLELRWTGDARLGLAPFPFGAPFSLAVPYRDLPVQRYRTAAELSDAWNAAAEERWLLELARPA